jgi:pilus assembly protein Flp/PilA
MRGAQGHDSSSRWAGRSRQAKSYLLPSLLVLLQNSLADLLHRGDRGATAIEYALVAALIAVVIVGGVTAVGIKVSTMFTNVANAF